MMNWRALIGLFCAALACGLAPLGDAAARTAGAAGRSVATQSWVEEWDPAAQRWVRIDVSPVAVRGEGALVSSTSLALPGGVVVSETVSEATASFALPRGVAMRAGVQAALAQYGPFRVLDGERAALVAATDVASPRHFDAMLRDHPGLKVLEMPDAPGTSHDLANLALGRRIRAAGLATHVPAGGSVRSGAVELFLAGTRQTIAQGATFAVHSWMDTRGLEPRHFAENAPENRLYLDYYEEMGMAPDLARAFYAMTNSVPHSEALWLNSAQMQSWIDRVAPVPAQELAPSPTLAAFDESAVVLAAPVDGPAAPPEQLAETAAQDVVSDDAEAVAVPVLVPVLVWFDLAPTMLARLDSVSAFP
jgi:hypothetical protein